MVPRVTVLGDGQLPREIEEALVPLQRLLTGRFPSVRVCSGRIMKRETAPLRPEVSIGMGSGPLIGVQKGL